MQCDTTFIYLKLRVHPIFWVRITCFSFSLSFSKWILFMLVQVKHKRTFYRFLLSKIECARINGGRNSETQQLTTTIGRTNAKYN